MTTMSWPSKETAVDAQGLIPVLETERLILRAPRIEDLDAFIALRAEFREHHAMPPDLSPVETCWRRLLATVGHWVVVGYGYWALEDKENGHFAGEVGFGEFKRALSPDLGAAPEAGWALARWAQGRGLALEALAAVHRWIAARGVARTVCMVSVGNDRSMRLAAKLDYRQYARARYDQSDVVLLERFAA